MQVAIPERTLTELDHIRLSRLLRRQTQAGSAPPRRHLIDDTLDTSAIVPSRQVPPDIVTMYSTVVLEDPQTGERTRLTLCYPEDAEPAAGFVSVLSPVGSSLLGLAVGRTARWDTPGGEARSAEIVAILFQPESSGDYTI